MISAISKIFCNKTWNDDISIIVLDQEVLVIGKNADGSPFATKMKTPIYTELKTRDYRFQNAKEIPLTA